MAKCSNCSAPLRANTNQCSYCGTHNDVDLQSKHAYTVIQDSFDRLCPHCEKPLQTIDFDRSSTLVIERCSDCFGLFFEPGEIETLFENSVVSVFEINLHLMDNINKDRYQLKSAVKYIKCPVCRVFMNRSVFGHRSGVIVDRCKNHGIWLDSGEITHLLEWKKAGGQLLHQRQSVSENQKRKPARISPSDNSNSADYADSNIELDVLTTLASLMGKLFI
jgi:Zn-finger nucleic acid-binding protein